MRRRVEGLVNVNAIAGTHVVFLAMDMDKKDASGLMGFAIRREDKVEKETIWLRGNKAFEILRKGTSLNDFSSLNNPFQAFQWADYTAKPDYNYVYTVFPMFGKPEKLEQGKGTEVAVKTEKPEGDKHSVYFNRAAISSQAYVKRFGLVDPEKVGEEALDWLTCELLPGLLAFIERAKDEKFSLHAAIYEAHFEPALKALSEARKRKAKVRLIYGAKPGDSITELNVAAIADAGLKGISTPRENAKIAHNKFIVLSRNDKPIAVWTGSTNWSTNGIYGQLNVGHAIDDSDLAADYLAYWNELKGDPEVADAKEWIDANNEIDPDKPAKDLQHVFSPHSGRKPYDWFISIAGTAKSGLFMTFPFGIAKDFRASVYDNDDGILRYAMLEKYVNGGTKQSRKEATDDTIRIRKFPNIGMALGAYIKVPTIDGWIKERGGIGTHVNWVHTKFMLVDPLGNAPVVISGSANWSLPSINENDENMVVIKGDRRVADIYFGEFMRIFAHYRFRESIAIHLAKDGTLGDWKPQDLFDKPSKWVPQHFKSGSEYALRRVYFAGA
jgi:phosphatidylserine/phosphatidylglycerophosphate/cardiolipin synthase-like enzyme